jgi:hypothetical protein
VAAFWAGIVLSAQQAVRMLVPGPRNGYCPTMVKTTVRPMTQARPKLPDCSRGDQDNRAGVASDRQGRAGAVNPRRGGGLDQGSWRARGGVEVDGVGQLRRRQ